MARRGNHTLEEIKNMVVTAAEELVLEGGLPQLRVRNIAMKIGYTVGSIYMVFDNMNDLILHIKGRSLDSIIEQMEQVKADGVNQRLAKLAITYINYAKQNQNRWSMIFEHHLPESDDVPAWYQQKVDRLYSSFDDEFAYLAPELSTQERRLNALAFLSGLHGLCVFRLTTQLMECNDHDFEESVALLVRKFSPNNGN